jgi:chromosome segregation ATPase
MAESIRERHTAMNVSFVKMAVLISSVCLLVFAGCVTQQEITSLDNRISELELRNVETRKSSQALKSGLNSRTQQEQVLRQQAASVRARMEALDEELRILSGKVEELEYQLKRQKDADSAAVKAKQEQVNEFSKAAKDNEERIVRLEQYLNLEPSGKTPLPPPPVAKIKAGTQAPPPLSEDEKAKIVQEINEANPDFVSSCIFSD